MFGEFRHKLETATLISLTFIAFCTPYYWHQWAFFAFIAFVVLVVGKILIYFND